MDDLLIEYSGLEEMKNIVPKIIEFGGEKKIWAFEGEMGAGKTTLIKAICKAFHVSDNVTSPTFSLVNEYRSDTLTFYHFDFYRIRSEREAFDIGCEEYFYSGNYCFIEWPSLIPNLLPGEILQIQINLEDQDRRKLYLSHLP